MFKSLGEKLKKEQKKFTVNLLKLFYGKIREQSGFRGDLKSIVILAREGFGDIIVLSPLIKRLKSVLPEIEITIVCVNKLAFYLKHDKNIKAVIKAKRPTRKDRKYLYHQEFDLLFNPKDHPSVTFLHLTAKIKVKQRVGIYHPQQEGFFDYMIRPDKPLLMIKRNCLLLDYLGISYAEKDLMPYMPEGPVSEEILQFGETIKNKGVIAINLSASTRTKEWHYKNWIEFLKQIDQPVMVIAMPIHYEQKQTIENTFKNVIKSPPTRSIFEVSHVIKHLKLLISPDTSLIHIASCFNIPVLAFYRIENDLIEFPPLSEKQYTIMAPEGDINKIRSTVVIEDFHKFVATL
jgi:ADP-heptose:LPS heptosyltransferase